MTYLKTYLALTICLLLINFGQNTLQATTNTVEPMMHVGIGQNDLQATTNSVEHVIHVSIDGMNATILKSLIENDSSNKFDNFKRLITEGASTFNARTDFDYTITIPNHTGMLTARPALQPAGMPNTTHHGYINNSNPAATDTLHNRGNASLSYIPSVFDFVHDSGLTTALYASKSKFVIFDQSYNTANGSVDRTGVNNGKDKIDEYLYMSTGGTAANLHVQLTTDLWNQALGNAMPAYTFIHYLDPDYAGHTTFWGSAEYTTALERADNYIGGLLALIESHASLEHSTVLIITTDHGGGNPGTSHHVATDPLNYTIPLFVWGKGVAQNVDLYSINPTSRQDPGTGRPDYTAAIQPIRNAETGTLALSLLGLPPISGSLMNTPLNVARCFTTHAGIPDLCTVFLPIVFR